MKVRQKITLIVFGVLALIYVIALAADPNKVYIGNAADDVILRNAEAGTVYLDIDSTGDTSCGSFKTEPVFMDEYNSALVTYQLANVGAAHAHIDTVVYRLITGCLYLNGGVCAETLSTDTVAAEGIVQKWVGRGAAQWKVADSTLNRWLWASVTIWDSSSNTTDGRADVRFTYDFNISSPF